MRNASRRVTAVAIAVLPAIWIGIAEAADTVVIGCLQRAGNGFTITDHRGGNVYRVEADNSTPERTLAWQAGMQLEVHGTVPPAPATAKERTLRATTVIRISRTCPKPAAK